MITIGMLGRKSQATKLKYAMACVAKMKDVNFFYFTPSDVNYDEKTIEGTYHTGDKWEKKTFDYPNYIYDRMLFRSKKKYLKLYEEFKNIPFNNEKSKGGSINKSQMYEVIENSGCFLEYIIPYITVETIDDIFKQLDKYGKIVCKANEGSLGVSVYSIEKTDETYTIQIKAERTVFDEVGCYQFIQDNILNRNESFVVQPFIQSRTNDGNPFDIRAHLMKDENGQWTIARIYPRIGARSSVVSNLHLGGSTCDIKMFLNKHITVENPQELQKDLQKFVIDFANTIEKQFDFHFSELGLDIAIDENEKVWLFEVNMNRINVQNLTFEAANLAISYGKYIATKNHDNTLDKNSGQGDSEIPLSQRVLNKFFK